MAEKGDKITLGFDGNGLRLNNESLLFSMDRQKLAYLKTTYDKIVSGEDRLVLKFDYSEKHKRTFLGIGVKKGKQTKLTDYK